ncbi:MULTISPECIES: ParB/RepB/Spo0J family partition protein [Actinomycetaceae]|uniref:ParB/RepB/Spo0J family partition protein n=1 Tax=Schaalia turicensis TaxID=131111 RepID=A0ABZ0RIQ5_9ACTO|nr:ParB/RepB/Spo0J family partition protein [Actinotignum sanguinis]MDV2436449.1 ParB/RepB/Spo0J family partition protein [Actinotignum sanguinis]WPJ88811.1 ParB/RepB/Spo0J family partition protein [Schaalia turicensis]
MATRKRRGLGSGLGALIPPEQAENTESPIDIFFGTVKKKDESSHKDEDSESFSSGQGGIPSASEEDPLPAVDVHQKDLSDEVSPLDLGYGTAGENVSRETSGGSRRVASKQSADMPKKKPASKNSKTDGVLSESKSDSGAAGNVSRETSEDADLVAVPGATYGEIDVTIIVPNHAQPRTNFDEDDLEELAQSIKEVGVLQPIVIRPLSEPLDEQPDARYELIMGERRWRASQRAGLTHIPAIIRRTSDEDVLRDALLENLHRADLNPLEEAAAYQQLLEDFQCTQDELAKRIARSRPQITNTLRLLKLPALVQRRVAAGVLSSGHARALLGLADAGAMERLAQRIVAEGLSVRAVEEIVALGDESTPAAPRRAQVRRFEHELNSVANQLGDRLNTRVKVDMGRTKGTMRIDFGSLEDLNRILSVLAPDVEGVNLPHEDSSEA